MFPRLDSCVAEYSMSSRSRTKVCGEGARVEDEEGGLRERRFGGTGHGVMSGQAELQCEEEGGRVSSSSSCRSIRGRSASVSGRFRFC